MKVVRSDNGGEYTADPLKEFCDRSGIRRHFMVKTMPYQNGVMERMNHTLLERARCILSNAGLGRIWWAEAVNTTCYLINRSPSSAITSQILMEVWSGTPCDYSGLRIFGCPAYFHVREDKLGVRARKAIFLGYPENVKGYRLWCPDLQQFLISRDVTFHEEALLQAKCERCRDGSPVWRGDSFDDELDAGHSQQVELGSSSHSE